MKIDAANLNIPESSHLLTDIMVPRPIAWVSTVDRAGIFNLAPFSAYTMVSTSPVVVGIGIGSKRDGSKKDTVMNIESMKDFVINVVTEELADAMNISSAAYPHDVSEFPKAGVTPIKADLVKSPMVAESPVNLECRLLKILEFGKAPMIHCFIIGEVLRVHIKDEFYDKKTKRVAPLNLVARLGGDHDLYCRTRDTFKIPRPSI